ncbi:hypothetical protein GCM10027082_24350 [Comamonas humi]
MAEVTLKTIYDRCDEVGECWIWRNATDSNGYPIIKIDGKCVLVRRVVQELKGEPAAPRQPVATKCEERGCCNPEHLRLSTVKKVAMRAAKRGAWSSPTRCAKVAAAKRASPDAKLTMDKAMEIRLSDKTSKALASDYGVNVSVIKGIRQGTMWRDYSSPLAGLGEWNAR